MINIKGLKKTVYNRQQNKSHIEVNERSTVTVRSTIGRFKTKVHSKIENKKHWISKHNHHWSSDLKSDALDLKIYEDTTNQHTWKHYTRKTL